MSLPIDGGTRDALTGLVAIGLVCTLSAIVPRAWARVPDLTTFVKDANYEPARLKERYLRNMTSAYAHNERVLRRKFLWFKAAVFVYGLALAIGATLTIWPRG